MSTQTAVFHFSHLTAVRKQQEEGAADALYAGFRVLFNYMRTF